MGSESLRVRFLCSISWGRESMPSPGFSSSKSEKKGNAAAKPEQRRDPYEVLGVGRNATDQEIKSAYRKLALRYVPLIYPLPLTFYFVFCLFESSKWKC